METIKTGWATAGRAQIYYEITGDGEPLVLLHGNGEDMRYFKGQIPAFSKKYKVIAIDTRAHGRSTRGGEPLDFYRFAEDVMAVLNLLEVEKAHVLGFSDGANTALHLALLYPQRVRSLILNGADLSPDGVRPSVQLPIIAGYGMVSLMGLFSAGARAKSEILGLMVYQPNLKPALLAEIKAPALVIAGEKDMILESHTRLIANSVAGARLELVPCADHFVASKMPAIFNCIVLKFLGSIGE